MVRSHLLRAAHKIGIDHLELLLALALIGLPLWKFRLYRWGSLRVFTASKQVCSESEHKISKLINSHTKGFSPLKTRRDKQEKNNTVYLSFRLLCRYKSPQSGSRNKEGYVYKMAEGAEGGPRELCIHFGHHSF